MEPYETTSCRSLYKKEEYSDENETKRVRRSPRLSDESARRKIIISKRKHEREIFRKADLERIAAEEAEACVTGIDPETLAWAEEMAEVYNNQANRAL